MNLTTLQKTDIGLSDEEMRLLIEALNRFDVKDVVVFGSRAKKNTQTRF